MYLVLILVVPVVAGASAHVRQRLSLGDEPLKLVLVDASVVVRVEHAQHLLGHLRSPLGRHVLVRLVHQAVRPLYLLGLPVAVGIVVVQGEEGGGVEVANVVLL